MVERPDIAFEETFDLPHAEALRRLSVLDGNLNDYGLAGEWRGNYLAVSGGLAAGWPLVHPNLIEVSINLGQLAKPLLVEIERQLRDTIRAALA